MKRPPIFNKVLFFINSFFGIFLLFCFGASFISPKIISFFSVFTLLIPILMVSNLIFFIYWLIKLKKQLVLSGFILIIGWVLFPTIFKFSQKEIILNDDIKIISYNVRNFNRYNWNKDLNTAKKIFDFILKKSPDVLLIQEFYPLKNINIYFPYQYKKQTTKEKKSGLAIYSKYKIINSGSLDFKNTTNNVIFADILKQKDTIRIYNFHLESLRVNLEKKNFGQKNSEKLFERIASTFSKQAKEVEEFLTHQKKWKGKKIIGGDFNNTPFSWVYRQIAKDKKDAFIEAGIGLGKSYNYFFPVRIDYILTDTTFQINQFKTFDVNYSDHYPILARISY